MAAAQTWALKLCLHGLVGPTSGGPQRCDCTFAIMDRPVTEPERHSRCFRKRDSNIGQEGACPAHYAYGNNAGQQSNVVIEML